MFNLLGLLLVLILPIGVEALGFGEVAGVRAMGLWLLILTPISTALAVIFVDEPAPAKDARPARMVDVLELLRGSAAVRRLLACDFLISLSFGMTGALFVFFFTKAKGLRLVLHQLRPARLFPRRSGRRAGLDPAVQPG